MVVVVGKVVGKNITRAFPVGSEDYFSFTFFLNKLYKENISSASIVFRETLEHMSTTVVMSALLKCLVEVDENHS